MPLLQKIQRGKFYLEGYPLSYGMCESLAASFKVFPTCIKEACLSQNGMKDKDLTMMLRGFRELSTFKTLVLKHNEIGL